MHGHEPNRVDARCSTRPRPSPTTSCADTLKLERSSLPERRSRVPGRRRSTSQAWLNHNGLRRCPNRQQQSASTIRRLPAAGSGGPAPFAPRRESSPPRRAAARRSAAGWSGRGSRAAGARGDRRSSRGRCGRPEPRAWVPRPSGVEPERPSLLGRGAKRNWTHREIAPFLRVAAADRARRISLGRRLGGGLGGHDAEATLSEKMESVWEYPRPPRVEPSSRSVRIEHGGEVVAESDRALRVLETASPPTIYLPESDVRMDLLRVRDGKHTYCEWKGQASYLDLAVGDKMAEAAAYFYPDPREAFAELRRSRLLLRRPRRRRVPRRRTRAPAARRVLCRLGHRRHRRPVQGRAGNRRLVG